MRKPIQLKVSATAPCASFEIEVKAKIVSKNLSSEEMKDVQRKLKQKLSDTIAQLPHSHIYPCEVVLK